MTNFLKTNTNAMTKIPNKKEFAATVHEQKIQRRIVLGLLSVEAVMTSKKGSVGKSRNTLGACSYCAICGSAPGKSRSN